VRNFRVYQSSRLAICIAHKVSPLIFDVAQRSWRDCSRDGIASESPHARTCARAAVRESERTRERATWWAVRSMKDALRGSRAAMCGSYAIRKIRRR